MCNVENCSQTFTTKQKLKQHRATIHDPSKTNFQKRKPRLNLHRKKSILKYLTEQSVIEQCSKLTLPPCAIVSDVATRDVDMTANDAVLATMAEHDGISGDGGVNDVVQHVTVATVSVVPEKCQPNPLVKYDSVRTTTTTVSQLEKLVNESLDIHNRRC
jgi:hypothetical protein